MNRRTRGDDVGAPDRVAHIVEPRSRAWLTPCLVLLAAAPLAHAQRADLSVTKTVDNATPTFGSQVTFTVTVSNAGPRPASAVTVRDRLPGGYTYVSSQVSRGSYVPSNGAWRLALPVNTSATLRLVATVKPQGNYTNVAEVIASSLPDPDSTPNNGNPTEDDYAARAVTPRLPNVAPVITGQRPLATAEDTALTVTFADLTVTDPDNPYPTGFSLRLLSGSGYTVTPPATLTPAQDRNDPLTVPVIVNDGTADSAPFNLLVTITPVNDPPMITAQVPLYTPESTPLLITLEDLTITDPDNGPGDFTLSVHAGMSYAITGVDEITPAAGFLGALTVPVSVSDGSDESAFYNLVVNVTAPGNAPPVITGQLELETAKETALTIRLDDLLVSDPDNAYPEDFTLTVLPGADYTLTGVNVLTPDPGFTGQLTVPVFVNDGSNDSPPYDLHVTVFVPLSAGCPKSHCTLGNTGWSDLPLPPPPVQVAWLRNDLAGESAGSNIGLSCSADGSMAVCTYNGASDNVVAYDYDGNRLWTSGTLLDAATFASVPLIFTNGDTVISDDRTAVEYDRAGHINWVTPLPEGGLTISPVLTSDGVIVLATAGGPVYAIDPADGTLLYYMFIRNGDQDTGYFHTHKTAAVRGNRVYVSTEHRLADGSLDPRNLAWEVALDIDGRAPNPADRIKVAWHYEFGARSLSSPMIMGDMILFDGERPGPDGPFDPYLFGIRDLGTQPMEVWKVKPETQTKAAFMPDPRPGKGFWYLQKNNGLVTRRLETDGSFQEAYDVGGLTSSAMTFAGTADHPVMILGFAANGRGNVLALDVTTLIPVWQLDLGAGSAAIAPGQFPLISNGTSTRVVFTTNTGGARAVGTVP